MKLLWKKFYGRCSYDLDVYEEESYCIPEAVGRSLPGYGIYEAAGGRQYHTVLQWSVAGWPICKCRRKQMGPQRTPHLSMKVVVDTEEIFIDEEADDDYEEDDAAKAGGMKNSKGCIPFFPSKPLSACTMEA